MSNIRNAKEFSYKIVIYMSVNLKKLRDIDDKLFGECIKWFIFRKLLRLKGYFSRLFFKFGLT